MTETGWVLRLRCNDFKTRPESCSYTEIIIVTTDGRMFSIDTCPESRQKKNTTTGFLWVTAIEHWQERRSFVGPTRSRALAVEQCNIRDPFRKDLAWRPTG